jgi:O-antigen ligase
MNAAVSIPVPRVFAGAFVPYAGFVVLAAMLFGGGTRYALWSDVLVQLAALPLLAVALFRIVPGRLDWAARYGIVLLGAIVALPLLQLIPLPPGVWGALPDRHRIAAAFDVAGMARPWLPITLDPTATWRSLLALIPAAAVFLAMLSLDRMARRRLMSIVLIVAVVSVVLGFLQMSGGVDSPLRFYAITNEDMVVGFFANGNHNAAFFYCAIPFAAARLIELYAGPSPGRVRLWRAVALLALMVAGVAFVGSRAGLGLALVAAMACVGLAFRGHVRNRRRIMLMALAGFGVALLIGLQFGLAGWEKRGLHTRDLGEDLRWPVAAVTSRAAQANLPLGTGIGTFVPVYQATAPRTLVFDRYVNHAHDDWLELWLEAGIPALALAVGFFIWLGSAGVRAWRPTASNLDGHFARAGSIAIGLLMLHSFVDYPLRSMAMMTVFALSCGFLTAPGRVPVPARPPD